MTARSKTRSPKLNFLIMYLNPKFGISSFFRDVVYDHRHGEHDGGGEAHRDECVQVAEIVDLIAADDGGSPSWGMQRLGGMHGGSLAC